MGTLFMITVYIYDDKRVEIVDAKMAAKLQHTYPTYSVF